MDSQATHASHKHVAIEAIEALRRMDTTAAEATVADIKAQKGCISLGDYVGRLGLDPGSEDGCPNAALAPMTAAVYCALTQGVSLRLHYGCQYPRVPSAHVCGWSTGAWAVY